VEYYSNTFAFRLRGLISGDDAERRCGGRLKTLGECRRRRRHGRHKLAVNVVDRVAGVGGRAHVKYCQECFSFDMPNDLWRKRVIKFESKFIHFYVKI